MYYESLGSCPRTIQYNDSSQGLKPRLLNLHVESNIPTIRSPNLYLNDITTTHVTETIMICFIELCNHY